MGIFSRVSDIANANINALLDKAEDPEKMVRLMISEMEETLVEVRTTSARMIADRKTLQRQLGQMEQLAAEWEGKAELAIQKNREDLARAALMEKREIETGIETAQLEVTSFDEQLQKLSEDIEHLQSKLSDAKARQQSLTMRAKSNGARLDIRMHLSSDSVEDALARFERYERKLDELEGQVEAFDMDRKSLHEEFAQMENEEKVADELAALKAKVQNKASKDAASNKPDAQ